MVWVTSRVALGASGRERSNGVSGTPLSDQCGRLLRLFHFLSWAISRNNWFSLGFPMYFVHTWSSFSWSLKSFLGHARRKYWFHIVFYSIFEPWASLEKKWFLTLFHFLSWAIFKNHWFSLGFPMFFANTWSAFSWSLKSIFGPAQRKYWFHIVFYSIFEPWAALEKGVCFILFHFLSWTIFKNHLFSLSFPTFFCSYMIWVQT